MSPLTYIYDVGAAPRVGQLESAIRDLAKDLVNRGVVRIDFIFVSHLDEDHVNRLRFLVKEMGRSTISVGTLVIPWLGPVSRLFGMLRQSHRAGKAASMSLLQSDASIAEFAANLGFVEVLLVQDGLNAADQNVAVDLAQQVDTDGAVVAAPVRTIASGTDLTPAGVPWMLLVTQLTVPKKTLKEVAKRIRSKLKLDVNRETARQSVIQSHAHRRAARAIMEDVAHAHGIPRGRTTITNWSSISLYSGSTNPPTKHPSIAWNPTHFAHSCTNGWIHTGDLPLNVGHVWQAFAAEWHKWLPSGVQTCVVTAPHHGSMNGHNIALFSLFNPDHAVFTYGLEKGSTKIRPRWAKKVDPTDALREVKARTTAQVWELSN
ncbi:hypothetical protein [Curtobacterium aurantiacum]|uniref:MBL fold metallo-hydrolase n=1 Tax=Curtobacterium aurantiacum TaxID=3236919 RepID=A0ABS5VDF4_9MICO|nr:hypothetical protein [Curtobacterium flaccumfaciens]MBT1544543.1 hypothetical protein [Curtobacterium flaccumfaciens pv. flaccumfaciens]MBT1587508.1 hypothetical protein [Curtobacterium flaccumfaciens pv. flaccumfaciens]